MKETIKQLGDSFRGLWKSYIYQTESDPWPVVKWTVTFILRGQYVETSNMDTPEEALNFAVRMVGGAIA